MNSQDADKLLEQNLSGDPPGRLFRARVLRDSTAAFVHRRGRRARWRPAAFSTAAVFIATVSFLLGRCSAPPSMPRSAAGPAIAHATDTVAVPSELVAWLDAARLFKQLGMEGRMGRALDRAGRLLPYDRAIAGSYGEPVFAAEIEATGSPSRQAGPGPTPSLHQSVESRNRIMAQSFGGYSRASEMD